MSLNLILKINLMRKKINFFTSKYYYYLLVEIHIYYESKIKKE